MSVTIRDRARRIAALTAATGSLISIAGCQPGQKIVARVKNTVITSDEFGDRALRVTSTQLQQVPGLDAGGTTMVTMVRDAIIRELATEKNVVPSDEDVMRVVQYTGLSQPRILDAIRAGQITQQDLSDSVKTQMEEFAIGTDGARAEQKDIDREYGVNKAKFALPAMLTVRTIRLPDEGTALQAIEQLKRTGDFKAVAIQLLGIPPDQAAQAGREQTLMLSSNVTPALKTALQSLTPGQITPKPVVLPLPNPQTNQTETAYVVAQLVTKQPARTLTEADVKPLMEQQIILKNHPDWREHELQVLGGYTKDLVTKGQIEIDVKRYQKLLDQFIIPMAEGRLSQAPANASTLSPRAPAPGQAPGPGGPPPGHAPGPGGPAPGGGGAPRSMAPGSPSSGR